MNNNYDGNTGLHEVAQYGALEELHRLTETESAKPRNRARTLLVFLAVMAVAPVIIAWILF